MFDLPAAQPLTVTERLTHGCHCAACDSPTRSAFPESVAAPVQYGKRINAIVLYLLHYQSLPEKRLSEVMDDLLGVHLATATVVHFSQDYAQHFQCFADAARDHVAAVPVKHPRPSQR